MSNPALPPTSDDAYSLRLAIDYLRHAKTRAALARCQPVIGKIDAAIRSAEGARRRIILGAKP